MSTVPEAQQCRADGCTARRVKHGAGRCEAHFRALVKYFEHPRNAGDSEAGAVRRALAARKRLKLSSDNPPAPVSQPDGPGKGSTPPDASSAVEGDSGDPDATPGQKSEGRLMIEDMYRILTAQGFDPLAVWRMIRTTMRKRGLPDSVLPPRPEPGETRPDPLLPVVRVSEDSARTAGRLAFGGIRDGRDLPAQLPLVPAPDGPRVPLLELADYRGGPIMAGGRGAPLDLRLFVGACLWTPQRSRIARATLVVKVRELRDWLFPNGWQRGRDWPKVRAALWKARDYTIPDGRGLWLPFALRRDPGENAGLDDLVIIDVELPPGPPSGPVIDRRSLSLLGVESAPRFRAYIAAHSVAWRPGVTRFPHPKNRAVKLWTGDPDKYPILTAEDRDRLAFGDVDRGRKEGRTKADGYWEDLPGVEIVGRMVDRPDGSRGWIVVPQAAADAIKRRDDPEEAT